MYTYCGNNPVNHLDPTGTVAEVMGQVGRVSPFLPAARLYAAPLLALFASPVLIAFAVGVGIGIMVAVAMSNREAYLKEREGAYQRAKHTCDEPPPPGLDKCADARFRLEKEALCVLMLEAFDRKYPADLDWQEKHPGVYRHADKVADHRRAFENASSDIDRFCPKSSSTC